MTDFLKQTSSSIETFAGREIYDSRVKSFYDAINVTEIEPNSIDTLTSRGLYGRVNRTNVPIIPDMSRIITLQKEKKEYFGFDFLLDAWFDFVNYYEPLAQRLGIVQNLRTDSLTTKQSFAQEYQMYILPTLESINKVVGTKLVDRYHVTQNKYKTLFYSVARTEEFSINPEKFLFSPVFHPTLTCLVIETDQSSFVDDSSKVKKYWDKEKFAVYVDSARRYGFMVDSFAPWRLYLDLNSKATSYYIRRREELTRIQALIGAGVENATHELNLFLEEFEPSQISSVESVHLDQIFGKYFVELGKQTCLMQEAANAGFSLFVG
jgi:hypothetical protein